MMNIETCPAKRILDIVLRRLWPVISLSVCIAHHCAYMYGVYGDSVIDIHLAVFVCLYWLHA